MRTVHRNFLLGLLCSVGIAAAQPEPIFTGHPVLIKHTGVSCNSCGGNAWDWLHSAMNTYQGRLLTVAAYSTSFNDYREGEQDLTGAHSAWLRSLYSFSSFPTLYVNMSKVGNQAAIHSAIDVHLAKTWTMGMNYSAWIEENFIKVARVFKTNEALSGEWKLHTFVTEDNIRQFQSGRWVNGVAELISTHKAVFRYNQGTVLPQKALNGTVYRDTITIPKPEIWERKNLNIGLVLFKDGSIHNAYTRTDTWLGAPVIPEYTISLTAQNGSVLRAPARETYDAGKSVNLTAVPDFGYHFTGWSGDLSGAENPLTVTMNSNKNGVANFEKVGSQTEIPLNELSLVEVSSEEGQHDYWGVYAIDGDPETSWHSRWTGGKAEAPHWVVLKLSQPRAINGVHVLSHHTKYDGMLEDYSIYLSNDGVNWGTAVATGTATTKKGGETEKIFFGVHGEATYFKLVWESGLSGYGSAAEIKLFYGAPDDTPLSSATVISSSSSGFVSSSSSEQTDALSPLSKLTVQFLKADAQGIRFSLSTQGTTTLRLVNITGQQLFERTVAGEEGTQEITWGRALSKGIYFVSLRSSLGVRQSLRFIVP